jgi:hypothetical protein
MSTSKFARCFPLPDGNVCCEHWNGSYIVFPAYGKNDETKNPTNDGEVSRKRLTDESQ